MTDPVQDLLDDIAAGRGIRDGLYRADAAFDATVPGWRFHRTGDEAVRKELAGWYADPGTYEELHRTTTPEGELVTFTLTWIEHGIPHAAHQAHVLTLDGRLISGHTAWCGGRWSAELLAEMADA